MFFKKKYVLFGATKGTITARIYHSRVKNAKNRDLMIEIQIWKDHEWRPVGVLPVASWNDATEAVKFLLYQLSNALTRK